MIRDNSYLCARNVKETRRCTHVYNMASYYSVCNIEVTDDGKALECDEGQVKKYDQLVTSFYGVRVVLNNADDADNADERGRR